jgi:hypothetical protein
MKIRIELVSWIYGFWEYTRREGAKGDYLANECH